MDHESSALNKGKNDIHNQEDMSLNINTNSRFINSQVKMKISKRNDSD